MKIRFLNAFNGDSILISFLENDVPRNILIGAFGNTYKSTSNIKSDLYRVIENIRENGQFIDHLILTHFDYDLKESVVCIFIDDPIQSMDSTNILSFRDLFRGITLLLGKQLIVSTHEENFHLLLQKKIP